MGWCTASAGGTSGVKPSSVTISASGLGGYRQDKVTLLGCAWADGVPGDCSGAAYFRVVDEAGSTILAFSGDGAITFPSGVVVSKSLKFEFSASNQGAMSYSAWGDYI